MRVEMPVIAPVKPRLQGAAPIHARMLSHEPRGATDMRTIDLGRVMVAGLIATFVMTMIGMWNPALGLPKLDVGAIMTASMNGPPVNGAEPAYSIAWGQAVHFANGVILALIYAIWLHDRLPGGVIVKGAIYGVITSIAAWLIVVPIATAAAGQPSGLFMVNAPDTPIRLIASLIGHVAYGITLVIGIQVGRKSPVLA